MYTGYNWPKLRGEAEMELRNLDSEKLVQGKGTRQQLLTRMSKTHTHTGTHDTRTQATALLEGSCCVWCKSGPSLSPSSCQHSFAH